MCPPLLIREIVFWQCFFVMTASSVIEILWKIVTWTPEASFKWLWYKMLQLANRICGSADDWLWKKAHTQSNMINTRNYIYFSGTATTNLASLSCFFFDLIMWVAIGQRACAIHVASCLPHAGAHHLWRRKHRHGCTTNASRLKADTTTPKHAASELNKAKRAYISIYMYEDERWAWDYVQQSTPPDHSY